MDCDTAQRTSGELCMKKNQKTKTKKQKRTLSAEMDCGFLATRIVPELETAKRTFLLGGYFKWPWGRGQEPSWLTQDNRQILGELPGLVSFSLTKS